jgi:hypothetical protein
MPAMLASSSGSAERVSIRIAPPGADVRLRVARSRGDLLVGNLDPHLRAAFAAMQPQPRRIEFEPAGGCLSPPACHRTA